MRRVARELRRVSQASERCNARRSVLFRVVRARAPSFPLANARNVSLLRKTYGHWRGLFGPFGAATTEHQRRLTKAASHQRPKRKAASDEIAGCTY